MPRWENSNRRDRLPPDWSSLRRKVLRRDRHQCQLGGTQCVGIATEVDHKRAGDDHSLSNLQAVCAPCHRSKSSTEGAKAAAAKRKQIKKRLRRSEEHPGLL